MTKKKSHEENVRYMYQFYKDTGQHDKAREYKQQQKNIARMFGRKDPFSSGGAAIGIGNLGGKYMEGIARQPELIPVLRTQMFIVLGLVDAVPMISVGIAFYLLFAVA